MKVRIKYQYPSVTTITDEAVIDIPDEANPQMWIDEHEEEILKELGAESDGLYFDIDMGYAKVELISGIIK